MLGGSGAIVAAGAARLGCGWRWPAASATTCSAARCSRRSRGWTCPRCGRVEAPTGISVGLARPGRPRGADRAGRARGVPRCGCARGAAGVGPLGPRRLAVPAAGARRRRDRRARGGHDVAGPGLGPARGVAAGLGGVRRPVPERPGGAALAGEEDVEAAALRLAGEGPCVVVVEAGRREPPAAATTGGRARRGAAGRAGRRHRRGGTPSTRASSPRGSAGRWPRRLRSAVPAARSARGRPGARRDSRRWPRRVASACDRVRRRLAVDRPPARRRLAHARRHPPPRGSSRSPAARRSTPPAPPRLGADVHAIALLRHRAAGCGGAGGEGDVRRVHGPGETRVACRSPTRGADRVLRARPGDRWRVDCAGGAPASRRARTWVAVAGSLPPARPAEPPACSASPARPAPAWPSTSPARRSASASRPAPTSSRSTRRRPRSSRFGRSAPRRGGGGRGRRPAAAITHGKDGMELATPKAILRADLRGSAPTRSAAATRRSAASSPRLTPARTGPPRFTAPPKPPRLTRRFRARVGWASRLPSARPLSGSNRCSSRCSTASSRRSPVWTSTRPRTRATNRVPVSSASRRPSSSRTSSTSSGGRVDSERHQRLVAERLDDLGHDLHPRQLRVGPRPGELEGARSRPSTASPRVAARSEGSGSACPANVTRPSAHAALTRVMVGEPMKAPRTG